MDLLSCEIESLTGIKLKTIPRWLINEARLEERLKSGDGRRSTIVITMRNSTEVFQLCSKGLRFGGTLKVIEKYWEAGPLSICMSCTGIGHDRLGGCDNRGVQCMICAGAHMVENHKCGVIGRTAKIGKICTHIIPKCANCGGNHQATAFKCPAKLRVQTEASKRKMEKAQLDEQLSVTNDLANNDLTTGRLDIDVNTEVMNSAKSLRAQSLYLNSIDDNLSDEAQNN